MDQYQRAGHTGNLFGLEQDAQLPLPFRRNLADGEIHRDRGIDVARGDRQQRRILRSGGDDDQIAQADAALFKFLQGQDRIEHQPVVDRHGLAAQLVEALDRSIVAHRNDARQRPLEAADRHVTAVELRQPPHVRRGEHDVVVGPDDALDMGADAGRRIQIHRASEILFEMPRQRLEQRHQDVGRQVGNQRHAQRRLLRSGRAGRQQAQSRKHRGQHGGQAARHAPGMRANIGPTGVHTLPASAHHRATKDRKSNGMLAVWPTPGAAVNRRF
jgi:hypothetical protein